MRRDFVKRLEAAVRAFEERRFADLDLALLDDELEGLVATYRSEAQPHLEALTAILMRPYDVYGDWNDLMFHQGMLRSTLGNSPSLRPAAAARIRRAYARGRRRARMHGEPPWPRKCPWPTLRRFLAAVVERWAEFAALERGGDPDFSKARRRPRDPSAEGRPCAAAVLPPIVVRTIAHGRRTRGDFVKRLATAVRAFRERRFADLDLEVLDDELEGLVGRYRAGAEPHIDALVAVLMRPYDVYGDWNDLRLHRDMLRAAFEDSPSLRRTAEPHIRWTYALGRLEAGLHGEPPWPRKCPWPTLRRFHAAVRRRDAEYLALERRGDPDFVDLRQRPREASGATREASARGKSRAPRRRGSAAAPRSRAR